MAASETLFTGNLSWVRGCAHFARVHVLSLCQQDIALLHCAHCSRTGPKLQRTRGHTRLYVPYMP